MGFPYYLPAKLAPWQIMEKVHEKGIPFIKRGLDEASDEGTRFVRCGRLANALRNQFIIVKPDEVLIGWINGKIR